jgi:hypothetical protein
MFHGVQDIVRMDHPMTSHAGSGDPRARLNELRTAAVQRAAGLAGSFDDIVEAAADVVFWDPFSPRANPELWSVAAFTTLRGRCRAGATVHTYSGATAVRSALLLAGFYVGVGEPTGEHKAATCAAVELAALERPLDRRWLERLGRSTAGFPADAPADAYRRVCEHPQFAV